MAKISSPLKTALRQKIKRLRSDARRLDAIANHLRQEAKELAAGIKTDERAERARTNFFSKPAAVDPVLTLTPDPADLFDQAERTGAAECIHDWGTDGLHTNQYCKKCFINNPAPSGSGGSGGPGLIK